MISSKRILGLIETDRGKEFYNNNFQDFLNKNNIKIYSRNTYLGAVLPNALFVLLDIFLKNLFLKKGDADLIDILPTITKQNYFRIHSSTKLTPIQASSKKNEGYVYNNFIDKRRKVKPKIQINDLVKTADLKKTFSKGYTTNWSYKLFKITEIFNDTIPSSRIDNLPERYNEALLKKTNLTMKKYDSVMIKLNLN